jgi:Cu+-exporting ATPase
MAFKGVFEETDPVCGKKIDTSLVCPFVADHKGKKYYFCSPECRRKFEADPEKFVKKQK